MLYAQLSYVIMDLLGSYKASPTHMWVMKPNYFRKIPIRILQSKSYSHVSNET